MSQKPLILALDTSQAACSVALGVAGDILARDQALLGRGHAESLMPMVDDVLAMAGVEMSALGRIAVIVGPGAYTGVRIGVAAARGLALALNIPCVGLTALEVLAASLVPNMKAGTVFFTTVAGRGDTLFAQQFEANGPHAKPLAAPSMLSLDPALKAMGKNCYGSGRVQLGLDPEVMLSHLPNPEHMIALATHVDPKTHMPEPLYLRAADAVVGKPIFPIDGAGG